MTRSGTGCIGRRRAAWAAFLAVAWGGLAVRAATERELYDAFKAHNITVDNEAIKASVVTGILRAVDPLARVCSRRDAEEAGARPALAAEELWAGRLAYLKLNGVFAGSGAELADRIRGGGSHRPEGVILDLRGAGGNDLDAVSRIEEPFAEGGDVLYEVRDGGGLTLQTYRAAAGGPVRAPVIVLIDADTHGASEVLAALLARHPGVMLVGTPSGGDGSVREFVPLGGGDELLYIATRRVFSDGRPLLDRGIVPDVAVDAGGELLTELGTSEKERAGKSISEKARHDRELMSRVATDPVLARAADILLGLSALGLGSGTDCAVTNAAAAAAAMP